MRKYALFVCSIIEEQDFGVDIKPRGRHGQEEGIGKDIQQFLPLPY